MMNSPTTKFKDKDKEEKEAKGKNDELPHYQI